MLQRIQSLYLAVTVILCVTLFALPFAEIVKDGAVYLFNSKGILLEGVVRQSGIWVVLVIALIAVLHVWAIFSFKNRMLQKKMVLVGMISLLGLFGLLFFYAYFSFSGATINLQIGFILPLIAVIVDYLAIRGINKDEALIRSIDRIR
jgi:glucan phosphoethanolaminetransferase (alkaline phosphatase superfamily)